ncbi:MAG TPA: LysR substrate-binding domain-containing protein [Steroidobacteraceae bacterium]|jgi:DNA-binding transcriptional LysR family regulator|nr:LysR substrate-binding domain-containing protein [Steroidobacteraceae bacterium]
MDDLNDLFLFSQVVEHNGFSGAAHALGMVPSRVSRRIAQLEERLGVRLVQRSTRYFSVTELGKEFNKHCLTMLAGAAAAFEEVARARETPSGLVRISCPSMLAQLVIGPLLPLFLENNPDVRIAIETTNRKVNIEENFDLSFRVRQLPCEDSGVIVRSLGIVQQVLVANGAFLDRHGRPATPDEVARLPSISCDSPQGPHVWSVVSPEGCEIQIRHNPVLIVDDLVIIRQAVARGFGLAQLPLSMCLADIQQGNLEVVLPVYLAPLFEIQVVFPSRHGILPAVRSIIDFLSAHCDGDVERWQIKQHTGQGRRESAHFWTACQSVEQLIADALQKTNRSPTRSG